LRAARFNTLDTASKAPPQNLSNVLSQSPSGPMIAPINNPMRSRFRRTICILPIAIRGFTLMELMVVLVIAGVMMTLAAPSFQSMLQTSRADTGMAALRSDLQFAQTEAMRSSQPVSVCASADGATCNTNQVSWQNGWIVFSDANSSLSVDSGDLIRRVSPALNHADTLSFTANTGGVTFNRLGYVSSSNALQWRFVSVPVNALAARCLAVTAQILGTVQTPASATTCP